MSDRRDRSQLVGDALRECAVLIAVLYPLDTIVSVQFEPQHEIQWSYVIVAEVFAGILLGGARRQGGIMNYYGPLLITFGFCTVLFIVGKFFQNEERKKRLMAGEERRGKAEQ